MISITQPCCQQTVMIEVERGESLYLQIYLTDLKFLCGDVINIDFDE